MVDSTYEDLTTEEKVRVNATLIDSLLNGGDDGLNALRRLTFERAGGNVQDEPTFHAAYQTVIDDMRERLASDLGSLPATQDNGIDEVMDLGRQRNYLRDVRELIGIEFDSIENGDITTGAYFSIGHYQESHQFSYTPELAGANPYEMTALVADANMRGIIRDAGLDCTALECVDVACPPGGTGITPTPDTAGHANEAGLAERNSPCR